MTFTANDVKTLREKTHAGMMDCKKALAEAKGNMETAIDILRKKGLSIALKKASRAAHEGMLGSHLDGNGKLAVLVEVNCETDFVVKTPDFQQWVERVTAYIKDENPKDLNALQGHFNEELTGLVAKIGENIQIRQFIRWQAGEQEALGFYLHAGSKIGALVRLRDPEQKGAGPAREIAMHVAAMHPLWVKPSEVPADVLAKEKEILKPQVDPSKPAEIREKILQGKLNKYLNDVCLENQIFVKDPEGKKTVAKWLSEKCPGGEIAAFARLQVGA